MHVEHRELLDALREAARPVTPERSDPQRYHGAERPYLNVSAPVQRRIARAWASAHKAAAPAEVLAVAGSLFAGASHDEKTLGALLLEAHRPARAAAGPADVDRWLDHLTGWSEVDSVCQNLFPAEQLLADWPAWKALIVALAASDNIDKRRASLVLLTGTSYRSADPRLSQLAFATIERLKHERPILITKAVSWLLRSLVKQHAAEVAAYLEVQAASLPAIAVRETRTKLATGRKA
jgi:3-methyladenine DNA glycosylase AlkD